MLGAGKDGTYRVSWDDPGTHACILACVHVSMGMRPEKV